MSQPESRRGREPPLVSGVVAGVVAFVLGYAVTFLAAGRRVEEALSDLNAVVGLVGGAEVPTWKAVGWLYLNAHTVVVELTGLPGGTRTYDPVAASDSASAPLLYVLPPLVVLLVVAVAVAADGARDAVSGAVGGVACVVGYASATAAVALLSSHAVGGGVQVAPAFVPAILLAGVVYPAVCGSVGGALAGLLRS